MLSNHDDNWKMPVSGPREALIDPPETTYFQHGKTARITIRQVDELSMDPCRNTSGNEKFEGGPP